MDIRALRERINLYIYASKVTNLRRLKIASFFISLAAVAGLFYYHGFALDRETGAMVQWLVEASFGFFIFHFLVKLFYDFHPFQFIKQHWFEASMVAVLLLEGIGHNLFGVLLVESLFNAIGLVGAGAVSVVFLQFYLFAVLFFELSDTTNIISNIKLHPASIFIVSYLVIIGSGTTLLMLPEMTNVEGSMPFIDALFTAVSATCVTGLSVVDPGTYFTFKGHFVLMMLMQLGGLTIVSFAYLAAFLNRFGFGLKQDDLIQDFTSKDAFYNAKGMLIRVFGISLLIELVGAVLIYALITPDMPLASTGQKIFFSVFHAISAFNNAGFSSVTDGFYAPFLRQAFLIHLVLAGLIVLGSFGFTVLFDLFTPSLLRDRLRHPWKRPHMSTLLAVRTHLLLLVIGTLLFALTEWRNVLNGYTGVEAAITSLFQSVSSRTAGFNSVDFHVLNPSTLLLIMCLMFVGGNTFSTAGGIKTSTFAVICINSYSVIRGKKNVEVLSRTIPKEILLKAFTLVVTFTGCIIGCVYVLTITESHILALPDRGFIDLMFEEISALATCGLSTGITGMLSSAGKSVIIFSMFIGRLGTLTIIFAFARKILTTNYQYPEEQIMIG